MKEFIAEHQEFILKILGIAALLFVLNRIAKIFKGPDGQLQIKEFLQMSAFVIFTSLAVYMVYKEANRDHEWHIFDAVYIFIIFGSLLSVLHMDHVITNITKVFELIVKIRSKAPEIKAEEPKVN